MMDTYLYAAHLVPRLVIEVDNHRMLILDNHPGDFFSEIDKPVRFLVKTVEGFDNYPIGTPYEVDFSEDEVIHVVGRKIL